MSYFSAHSTGHNRTSECHFETSNLGLRNQCEDKRQSSALCVIDVDMGGVNLPEVMLGLGDAVSV